MLTITCISMVKGITGSQVAVTFYRCLREVMAMDPGFVFLVHLTSHWSRSHHTLVSLSCCVPFCTKVLTLGWHLTFFSGTLELAQSLSRSLHCFRLALLSATRSIWLVICRACVDFDWWLIIILCPKIHKQCERTNYESVWKSFLMVCIMTCTCNPFKFTCLKCVLDSVQ